MGGVYRGDGGGDEVLLPPILSQKVFFAIVYGSVSFGYSLSELQTFGAAIASAKYVFGIIDRVS